MSNSNSNQVLTRKIKLYPVGDKEEVNRVYKYLREGMEAQNRAMNQFITALYVANMQEATLEDRKELNKLYARISTSKLGSAYAKDIELPKGLPIGGGLSMKVKQDFSKQCKQGLLHGRVSLTQYKLDNPLIVHNDYITPINLHKVKTGLYYDYENHTEFLEHLNDKDVGIYIKFANGITFKVILGQPHKSQEIRSVFKNIFEEIYDVCDSSIQIDGTKIILNLSLRIPNKEIELDEDTVVGVDLGLAIPAVCGLNNNDYIKQSIGSKDDFLRVRTKIQAQKRQLQKSLKNSNGGHGRKKKLAPLDKFAKYEHNFVKTYNHMVSHKIVDFAVKNKAKYINMEDLSGFDSNQFILRNWSYYELQQDVVYKAKRYGIEVRFINPYHTSQNCSKCGHWEEGQRDSQSHFKCKCCGHEENADFNASKNIAKSVEFTKIK